MLELAIDPRYFVFLVEHRILQVLWLVLLVVKVVAVSDALIRSRESYQAADKQTKTMWMAILAIGLALHVFRTSPLDLFNLVGTVAALVYLLDVRPILRSMHRR
ncbi:MAG: DUF2516 family protein [Nocardioidaceae bacterium]